MDYMIDHLAGQIERRNVVPFIGAGLSKAAGLPLWGELVQDMKNELLNWARSEGDVGEEERYLNRADYLDIAARFKHKVGLGHYQRFLQERYRRPDKGPVEVHRALARISWPFVITTNYDKLLEATFRTPAGFDPRVVIEQEELVTAFAAGEFFILKLHGDIDRPQSIVLTRDEYNAFVNSDRGRLMLDVLRRELILRTVLFLGFGLTDPNFLRVFGEAGWLAKGYQGEAYAVMADTSQPEREEWAQRSLRIIPIDNYKDLAPLLHRLADNVGAPAIRELVVEREPPRELVEKAQPPPPESAGLKPSDDLMFLASEAERFLEERASGSFVSANPRMTEFWLDDAEEDIKEALARIKDYRRNLMSLEKQVAVYGGPLTAPISLLNNIDSMKQSIAEYLQRLREKLEEVYGKKYS